MLIHIKQHTVHVGTWGSTVNGEWLSEAWIQQHEVQSINTAVPATR